VNQQQHAAGTQVRARLRANAIEEHASVGAGFPRARQSSPRQLAGGRRHVGRIGDDQVEPPAPHGLEQIADDRADADPVEPRVAPCRHHGLPGHVDRHHIPAAVSRRRHRQHATAGAQVKSDGVGAKSLALQLVDEHPGVAGRLKHSR